MTLDVMHHEFLLKSILKDIFVDETVSTSLGFKGGTAAMLFYGLTRFSIDLDFDLLDEKEDRVFDVIKNILEKYGVIKDARKKRYSLFFLLNYHNKLKGVQNIKIEINKRSFGSRYEIKLYLGIPMRVMVKEDMAAHKMVAMYERMGKANRDIYDVWFFLHNNWPINKHIIEQRTKISYKDFLQNCIDALEKIGDRGILSGLGELLDEEQKRWAKAKLRSDTIFRLKLLLSTIG